MTTNRTIFGREPVAWLGFVEAAISLLSILVFHWSADQISLIIAVVSAVLGGISAWKTVDTGLGIVLGLLKAVIALAVGFGFNLDPNVTASILLLVSTLFALIQRAQTSPVDSVKPTVVAPVGYGAVTTSPAASPNLVAPVNPVGTDPHPVDPGASS